MIDVKAGNTAAAITAYGCYGSDRMHFTGALKESGTHSAVNENGVSSISLVNAADKTIHIDGSAIESYTDALENKPTVEVAERILKDLL